MRSDGDQLLELTALIDAGKIRPVVDRVFPFARTGQAMEYLESGRAKAGKVVVTMRSPGPASGPLESAPAAAAAASTS
ncbi:zinc-binding dehydrogenase [Streptomyces sp. NPDC091268]|uniref:zinc-binding dehydrogenase n=1 Tax=Streptomyces sp. NPDC091268 TaxID=3365979 RepID=UPI003827600A